MDDPRIELEDMKQATGGYLAEDEMSEPDKWLQLTFAAWSVRMQQAARQQRINNTILRAARETTQGSFLMSALRRNGVL